ncbi:MAG: MFS transporter [Planctomyces sp.]|nr:MFS transporter [Planctomyces sp.]
MPDVMPESLEAETLPRRSAAPRYLIALAFVAFISLGLPDGVLGVAWPSMRQTLERPLDRLGVLLICGMAGYLASSFFSGQVVARLGVGGLLAASGGLVTLALAGYALAPRFEWLIPCAAIGGLGGGAIDAGINAFAAARFSPRIVNWLHASFGIGATSGPALMTLILAREWSWRIGYGVLAGLLAGLSVVFLLTARRWRLPTSSGESPSVAPFGDALRMPAVWHHAGLFVLYCGIESTAGQLLFTLNTEGRGMSVVTAGTVASCFWGAFTFGRIVFGQLTTRMSSRAVLRTGTLLAPVAAGLVWWNPSPAASVAGNVLLGFALAPVFPTLISVTPERLGSAIAPHAIGMQVSAAAVGIALMPTIVGSLGQRLGLEAIAAAVFVATLLLLAFQEWLDSRLSLGRGAGGSAAAPLAND